MPGQLPSLEQHLDQLLAVERFEPPAGFVADTQVGDAAVYAQAADAPAWWAEQARQRLAWDTPFSTVLDDSNTAPGDCNVVATSQLLASRHHPAVGAGFGSSARRKR